MRLFPFHPEGGASATSSRQENQQLQKQMRSEIVLLSLGSFANTSQREKIPVPAVVFSVLIFDHA